MESLVSVIIPVYNVAPYLREALDSVIYQTYRNLEILIVDDGSTDESGSICDEYNSDHRVTVIHQENRGLSGARNTGLNQMTGDYVAFLDPDDAYNPDMIQTLGEAIQREDADIVVSGYAVYRTIRPMKDIRPLNVYESKTEEILSFPEAANALINGKIACAVWNKLYRKRIWESIRFPEGRVYEDISVCFQVFHAAERIVILPGSVIKHRTRPGSITQTRSLQNARDWMTAHQGFEDYVREKTSSLFSEEQLQYITEQVLRGAIAQWLRIPVSQQKDAEDFRQIILKKGKIINRPIRLKRTKISYWMICHCPWLLRITYPLYRPVRLLVLKVTGR